MSTNAPRAVFVTRETDYELLIARHATREQARFFLKTRGQDLDEVERRHARFHQVLTRSARDRCRLTGARPWCSRRDLDRFLFAPDDVVVAVGQDGLVANVAKYLDGQPVLGVNPGSRTLRRHPGAAVAPSAWRKLLAGSVGRGATQRRTMVEAELDDGQKLLALNEIFIGHRSHQSARYDIERRRPARVPVLVRRDRLQRHRRHRLGALDHGEHTHAQFR